MKNTYNKFWEIAGPFLLCQVLNALISELLKIWVNSMLLKLSMEGILFSYNPSPLSFISFISLISSSPSSTFLLIIVISFSTAFTLSSSVFIFYFFSGTITSIFSNSAFSPTNSGSIILYILFTLFCKNSTVFFSPLSYATISELLRSTYPQSRFSFRWTGVSTNLFLMISLIKMLTIPVVF